MASSEPCYLLYRLEKGIICWRTEERDIHAASHRFRLMIPKSGRHHAAFFHLFKTFGRGASSYRRSVPAIYFVSMPGHPVQRLALFKSQLAPLRMEKFATIGSPAVVNEFGIVSLASREVVTASMHALGILYHGETT